MCVVLSRGTATLNAVNGSRRNRLPIQFAKRLPSKSTNSTHAFDYWPSFNLGLTLTSTARMASSHFVAQSVSGTTNLKPWLTCLAVHSGNQSARLPLGLTHSMTRGVAYGCVPDRKPTSTNLIRMANQTDASAADNMVFTQGRGFVRGASFGLPRRGHRLFGNVVSFL